MCCEVVSYGITWIFTDMVIVRVGMLGYFLRVSVGWLGDYWAGSGDGWVMVGVGREMVGRWVGRFG